MIIKCFRCKKKRVLYKLLCWFEKVNQEEPYSHTIITDTKLCKKCINAIESAIKFEIGVI